MSASPEGTFGITRAPCRAVGLAVSSVLHLSQWTDCSGRPDSWQSIAAVRNCQWDLSEKAKPARSLLPSHLPPSKASLWPRACPAFPLEVGREAWRARGSSLWLPLPPALLPSCSPAPSPHALGRLFLGSLHPVLVPQEKTHFFSILSCSGGQSCWGKAGGVRGEPASGDGCRAGEGVSLEDRVGLGRPGAGR